MTARDDVDKSISSELPETEGDADQLEQSIAVARYRFSNGFPNIPPLQDQIAAYSTLGYYYAVVKDKKRRLSGPQKLGLQFTEDYLEGPLKALDKGIIMSQHLNNLTGRHNT